MAVRAPSGTPDVVGPTPGAGSSGPLKLSWWVRSREARIAWLFILPYVVLFMAFRFGPVIASFVLSVMNFRITGGSTFVGTENYARLVADQIFWNALRVTAVYTGIAVPLTIFISLSLALLTSRAIRGIKVFRAFFFLPVVTSLVVGSIVWRWIYQSNGPLNGLLNMLGMDSIAWLQRSDTVLPALAGLATWNRFGFTMLILLAGLQAIPEDYQEAARIDGATARQRFFRITLPLLKPTLFFVLVLETIQSFQVFDAIYLMTQGGPVRASYSLVFMIYDQGFSFFDFGYASAVGVVLFLVTMTFALIQRRLVGRTDT